MELLTANQNGKYRVEKMNGRTYFVLPVRMIVPGVLTGNRGSLLYREKEIAESIHNWNNVPIVVDHPKKDGVFVSARAPDVIARSGVGYVFNAHQKHGNLDGEAWIDIEKLQNVDADMAAKVRSGEPVEVSTGLGTYNASESGSYNGKQYTHVAKNHSPDHLALLSSEKGACSLEDGCGLAVNEMKKLVEEYEFSGTSLTFSQWQTVNSMCKCHGTCGKCKNEQVDEKIDFQPVTNADGFWRTTEDGQKIYIKDGQAYAGGPNGKAIGSKSDSPKAKKDKWDFTPVADKQTLKEYQDSAKGISDDIKSMEKSIAESGSNPQTDKQLASLKKKYEKTQGVIEKIKSEMGKNDPESSYYQTKKEQAAKENLAKAEKIQKEANKLIDKGNDLVYQSNQVWGAQSDELYSKGQKLINEGVRKQDEADKLLGQGIYAKSAAASMASETSDSKLLDIASGKSPSAPDIKEAAKSELTKRGIGIGGEKLDLPFQPTTPSDAEIMKQYKIDRQMGEVGSFAQYKKDFIADTKTTSQAKIQDSVLSAIDSGKVKESDFAQYNTGSQTSESGDTHVGMKVKIDKNYGGGSGYVVGFDKRGSFALVKKGGKVESYHSSNIQQSKPKK